MEVFIKYKSLDLFTSITSEQRRPWEPSPYYNSITLQFRVAVQFLASHNPFYKTIYHVQNSKSFHQ